MNKSQAIWPGYELTAEQDVQWIESGTSELDPAWRFIDSNGHGHFVTGDKGDPLPTLEWVPEPCTMGHDDCDAEGHYECRTCREVIQPGSRMAGPVRIDGPTTYTLTASSQGMTTVYRFYAEEWDRLQTAVAAAVETTLAEHAVERTMTGR